MKDNGGAAFRKMTIRQFYKGMALAGLLGSPGWKRGEHIVDTVDEWIVAVAEFADAMIAEDKEAEKHRDDNVAR